MLFPLDFLFSPFNNREKKENITIILKFNYLSKMRYKYTLDIICCHIIQIL